MISFLSNSVALRSLKYGYSNARTKAMKSTLLTVKELESMIEAKNVSEILSSLQRTSYKADLVEEAFEGSGADLIELSLGKNFARTLTKLIKISPKSDAPRIVSLFERYDVLNLKTILLGKHLNEPKEKIKLFLVESPRFNEGTLNRMLDLKDVKDVVSFLGGTPYSQILDKKLKQYQNSGEISVLVNALDNYPEIVFSENYCSAANVH